MAERLFDFNFVDRKEERKIISDFISYQTDKNILWLNGSSGVGKSYLIQNTALLYKSNHNIFISPQAQGQTDTELKSFIKQIEKDTGVSFINFLKNNYSSITDISKKIITSLLAFHNIDLEWFFDIAFDTSKLFISSKDEKQNTSRLIEKYIEEILGKNYRLLVILDNFTYCDYESQTIFINLLKTFMNHGNIKFIISTTQEELEKQSYLKVTLLEKLDTSRIFLDGFKDVQCFRQIIEQKFIMTTELNELILYIFEYCKGVPESLKEILRNLVLSNSIYQEYSLKKAAINIENLKNYLLNANMKELPQIDFSLINEIESFFLQVITYIKYPVLVDMLEHVFTYLCRCLFYEANSIQRASVTVLINKYIGLDVLKCHKEKQKQFISFKHDLLYLKLNEHFSNYINKEQIFFYLYQFICTNYDDLCSSLDTEQLQYMMAYYSYQADADEWMDVNYKFGLKKFNMSLFHDAIEIFQRLVNKTQYLTDSQKLTIAKCYYDVGEYNQCSLLLKTICAEKLSTSEKYSFHLTSGKVLFVKLDAMAAIAKFNTALTYAPSEIEYYDTLSMKLTALAETHDGSKEAKEIFEKDIKKFVEEPQKKFLLGDILRNCWSYCTGEDAITYLNIALELSQESNNVIDMAYTYNNLGLEYVRGWELTNARSVYMKALDLLNNTKKHETSYPLNNLAVVEMLNKNYQSAFDYLIEANLWNRAPFMQYVIKTHLLMCSYYLNNIEVSENIANELYDYLFQNNIQDDNTIRKLSLNLGIYYWNVKNNDKAKKCITYSYNYAKNTYCEYRATVLYNRIMNANEPLENIKFSSFFYQRMDFEPWIATLSHQ